MIKDATDIVVESIVTDPTRLKDVVELVRGNPLNKTEAVRNYWGKTLRTGLLMENQVVDSILQRASWELVTERICTITQEQ